MLGRLTLATLGLCFVLTATCAALQAQADVEPSDEAISAVDCQQYVLPGLIGCR